MTPRILTGRRQQGLVMVIALIMLLAVTLMVVAASNLVNANLKVVQNMEIREQARSAAVAAIEEAISNGTGDGELRPRFVKKPDDIFLDTCDGTTLTCARLNNVKKYDTNGDGNVDITVTLSDPIPRCVVGRIKLESELTSDDKNFQCSRWYVYSRASHFTSLTIDPDQAKNVKDDSRCGVTTWEFNAVARDSVTGAEVVVRQGVDVLAEKNAIDEDEDDTYCPPDPEV